MTEKIEQYAVYVYTQDRPIQVYSRGKRNHTSGFLVDATELAAKGFSLDKLMPVLSLLTPENPDEYHNYGGKLYLFSPEEWGAIMRGE